MSTKVASKKKEEVAVAPSRRLMVGPEDIDIQKINLIQKTSGIVEDAPAGSIYINRSYPLVKEEGDHINVTVVKAKKMWKEDIPYDEDAIPQFANTIEEKAKLEETSEYPVIECADITVLVSQPEGEDDPEGFPYPLGDLKINVGKFHVHKDAYRCTYKRLATQETFNPNVPVWGVQWKLGSELMKKGKHAWYVPTLVATGEASSEAVVEFCNNIWEAE